jgi:purine/pyrimidine-nucleoside phosphorylase
MSPDTIQAAVSTRASVYFDGKCVSHAITLPDGTKKSVGVILPSTLTFNTGAPERMELVEGECLVTLHGAQHAVAYQGGQSFEIGGDSSFKIEVTKTVHYICHFG